MNVLLWMVISDLKSVIFKTIKCNYTMFLSSVCPSGRVIGEGHRKSMSRCLMEFLGLYLQIGLKLEQS